MSEIKKISTEKFEAINRTFLELKHIGVLMDCSISKAAKYRKKFLAANRDDSDFFQPMVRTTDFIHFYKIDIDRIRENFKVFNKGNNYAELQD